MKGNEKKLVYDNKQTIKSTDRMRVRVKFRMRKNCIEKLRSP